MTAYRDGVYELEENELRSVLSLTFLALFIPAAIIDGGIQPYLLWREETGQASAYELHLLHTLFNRVGDFTAAFAIPLIIIVTDVLLQRLKLQIHRQRAQEIISTLQHYLPYAVVSLFMLVLFDTELPGGLTTWGDPFISDLWGGLVGVIGFSALTEFAYRDNANLSQNK